MKATKETAKQAQQKLYSVRLYFPVHETLQGGAYEFLDEFTKACQESLPGGESKSRSPFGNKPAKTTKKGVKKR